MPIRYTRISPQLFAITKRLRCGLYSRFNKFLHFRNKFYNLTLRKRSNLIRRSIIMPSYEGYNTQATKTKAEEGPDKNCRTCSDFKFWSRQQKRQLSGQVTDNAEGSGEPIGLNSKNSSSSSSGDQISFPDKPARPDCPLDKSVLGCATWGLLHTIAAFYPETPTPEQKQNVKTFFDSLSKVYPCDYCARDFRKDLKDNPICVDNQEQLSLWLCQFHNRVNKKLGKPEFDCTKTNERWRDGWADGSCD